MKSMTGFASGKGSGVGVSWVWDIRAVNARGMDARLRVPDWVDGLEQALRPAIQKCVARGNVNLTLKVSRDDMGQGGTVNPDALEQLLSRIKHVQETAREHHGLELALCSAADVLQMPGLMDNSGADVDTVALKKVLQADLKVLLAAFDDMRKTEGKALHGVIADQLQQIETLVRTADTQAQARREKTAATLQENLALVMQNPDGADPDRVAQELAMLAVKSDVKEELDRLHAHVAAAREMLDLDGPVGRKLDFLSQEFNREANTLCSKAQSNDLTRTGLELKAVIEQMREQVQNVE